MANELPEDLVLQTLLSLPVVSLLRFKCVCKSWYALITRHDFIREHILHHRSPSKKNKNALFLLSRLDKTTRDHLLSTLSYQTLQVSLTQPLPPPYFGINEKVHVFVVGSCDGLLCLSDKYAWKIFIWNPATKETKVVPESTLRRLRSNDCGFGNAIRFGFDSKTNDYKIIRLLRVFEFDPSVLYYKGKYMYESDLYSLRTNSWRHVDSQPWFDVPYSFIYDGFMGTRTDTNGMASWPAQGDCEYILSFDMSKEVFLRTPMPDKRVIGSGLYNWRDLFLLNESVALSVRNSDEEQSDFCFHIWLLGEFGVEESWRKIYTLGPLTGFDTVLGFWKDDALFFGSADGRLFLYDSSTKEMNYLQIDGEPMTLQLITFMETLVSVKVGNETEEQNNS
ncbi:F-box/kelch-repeat protein At3g23880-like [Carya illinoinensis]|uniref:F-box domain-containing protein n=1 Tax=Carya illinoinensis TaxID=32201 RepID=A0A8T1Q0A1_CARIL|nr:F-box/kelch-repeat protein At3g23880-like [Carya illinoinensis]KAG6645960.1 hypothetical protein CIPAW_08G159300 [Carya illinoinensis]